jgi:hypothetical protein
MITAMHHGKSARYLYHASHINENFSAWGENARYNLHAVIGD